MLKRSHGVRRPILPIFWAATALGALMVTAPAPSQAATYLLLNTPMPKLSASTVPAARSGFTPAPRPNPDLFPPQGAAPVAGQAEIAAHLHPPSGTVYNGAGFSPGSAYSSLVEFRNHGANVEPTVGLKVPLD